MDINLETLEDRLIDIYYCDYSDKTNGVMPCCEWAIEQLLAVARKNKIELDLERIQSFYKSMFPVLMTQEIAKDATEDFMHIKDIDTLFDKTLILNDDHEKIRTYFARFLSNQRELTELLDPDLDIFDQSTYNQSIADVNAYYDNQAHDAHNLTISTFVNEDGWVEDLPVSRPATPKEIQAHLESIEHYRQASIKRLEDNAQLKNKLVDWLQFFYSIPELSASMKNIIDLKNLSFEIKKKIILDNFHNNTEFCEAVNSIMNHDKKTIDYYYHGTQSIQAAENILCQGLLMMQKELSSTSYREFTPEQLILYERGFGGEIGHDAVVIIGIPKGKEIVKKIPKDMKADVTPSGLQGFGKMEYYIPAEYIVGYVDKMHERVIYSGSYIFDQNPGTPSQNA